MNFFKSLTNSIKSIEFVLLFHNLTIYCPFKIIAAIMPMLCLNQAFLTSLVSPLNDQPSALTVDLEINHSSIEISRYFDLNACESWCTKIRRTKLSFSISTNIGLPVSLLSRYWSFLFKDIPYSALRCLQFMAINKMLLNIINCEIDIAAFCKIFDYPTK